MDHKTPVPVGPGTRAHLAVVLPPTPDCGRGVWMTHLSCVPRPTRREPAQPSAWIPDLHEARDARLSAVAVVEEGLLVQPHGPQEVPGLLQETRNKCCLPTGGKHQQAETESAFVSGDCFLQLPPTSVPSLPFTQRCIRTLAGTQAVSKLQAARYLGLGSGKKRPWLRQLHS